MKAQVRQQDDGRWVWRILDEDGETLYDSGPVTYGEREDAALEAELVLEGDEAAWEDV